MDTEALVFVVDDASMRTSLQNLLWSVGLRVEAFTSAQDFLRSTRPEVPSCLVLDVRLPDHAICFTQRGVPTPYSATGLTKKTTAKDG